MTKYAATMDGRGRIQLPEELRRAIGWSDLQWYQIEKTEDGHNVRLVIVSENGQPNVWMSKASAKQAQESSLPGTSEMFALGRPNPGFHSNVASTPGLKGQTVVKFRAEDGSQARKLASTIIDNLEKHP